MKLIIDLRIVPEAIRTHPVSDICRCSFVFPIVRIRLLSRCEKIRAIALIAPGLEWCVSDRIVLTADIIYALVRNRFFGCAGNAEKVGIYVIKFTALSHVSRCNVRYRGSTRKPRQPQLFFAFYIIVIDVSVQMVLELFGSAVESFMPHAVSHFHVAGPLLTVSLSAGHCCYHGKVVYLFPAYDD